MTQEVAFELRDQIQKQRQWETMTREQKQQQLLLRHRKNCWTSSWNVVRFHGSNTTKVLESCDP